MEKFIESIQGSIDIAHCYMHIAVTLLCWVLVIMAILIDLWDGIYTARKLGEKLLSHKFRHTVQKAGEYWRLLLFGFIADTLGLLLPWYALPYITMALCVSLVFIEMKSVFEHYKRRKSGLAALPGIAARIVECVTEKDAVKLISAIKEELEIDKKVDTYGKDDKL